MKRNKLPGLWLAMLFLTHIHTPALRSQDRIPALPPAGGRTIPFDSLREYKFVADLIATRVLLPENFKETRENRLTDNSGVLIPMLEHLRLVRLRASRDSVRIVHVGDSHVRGRIFPNTVRDKLQRTFGAVAYTNIGVNGATCLTFTHSARIMAIKDNKPELIILSFGTNESHNKRYSPNAHYNQIDELVKLLRQNMPGVPIMLTTPPGSYESFRQKNRRRKYSVNPRTPTAVRIIKKYAEDNRLALWDMYETTGGEKRACENWKEAGLLRPDHVHFLPEGYVLQGELLFEGIINAYNDYVSD